MKRNQFFSVLLCILAGALAGAANGIFGAGGGLVLVPFFIRVLSMDETDALPTSIAVILPLSFVSALTYHIRIEFQTLLPFFVGGLAGGLVGGLIFRYVSTHLLRQILGIFILYSGLRAIFAW